MKHTPYFILSEHSWQLALFGGDGEVQITYRHPEMLLVEKDQRIECHFLRVGTDVPFHRQECQVVLNTVGTHFARMLLVAEKDVAFYPEKISALSSKTITSLPNIIPDSTQKWTTHLLASTLKTHSLATVVEDNFVA